jgi:hypothetical protein
VSKSKDKRRRERSSLSKIPTEEIRQTSEATFTIEKSEDAPPAAPNPFLPRCIRGMYAGTRAFKDGPVVSGWFGRSDVEGECTKPVEFMCHNDGTHGEPYPMSWYACADPEHHRGADRIVKLPKPIGDKPEVKKLPPEMEVKLLPPAFTSEPRPEGKR